MSGGSCVHLVVEDLGLGAAGLGDEVRPQDVDHVRADVGQLLLNLFPVALDERHVLGVSLGLLKDDEKGKVREEKGRAGEEKGRAGQEMGRAGEGTGCVEAE